LGKNTFSIRKKYTELEIKLKTRKSFWIIKEKTTIWN
jgi:hypothetical protein